MKAKKLLPVFALFSFLIACSFPASALEPGDWPREITVEGYGLVLHQPQVDKWEDYSKLEARVVVELIRPRSQKPELGAISFTADTRTDMDSRTVSIHNLRIVNVRFPSLSKAATGKAEKVLNRLLPKTIPGVPLDTVLANMARTKASARTIDASNRPPKIIVSSLPAILVLLDGEPVLQPIGGTDLMFAINTDKYLFFHTGSWTYYLFAGDIWLKSEGLDAKWTLVDKLPRGFSLLPDKDEWKEVRKHLKPKKGKADVVPVVFVSTTPAELILIDGDPKLTPIKGTSLLYVTNTDSDLFFFTGDGHYYCLIAGRWFRGRSLEGPWEAAGKTLPQDFSKIPADHDMAHVLISVPGTAQAREAVMQAQIPRRATIKRDAAQVEVTYDGDPSFEPIKGTSMERAVNTAYDIIRVRELYYLCYQGVWFVSESPLGPWEVCDSVPQEIYSIPPESPIHHVTYVYVYGSTPDEVEVGYTAGYEGSYVSDQGTVVYGTGFPYLPYVAAGVLPIYYPHGYPTYGAGVFYNPYTGVYGAHRQGGTAYAHWGESVIGRGDQYLHTGTVSAPRRDVRALETGSGAQGAVVRGPRHDTGAVKTGTGNLYVGRDGNIYKKTDDGWSKYQGHGEWDLVEPPAGQRRTSEERPRGRSLKQDLSGERHRFGDTPPVQRLRDRRSGREGLPPRLRDQRDARAGIEQPLSNAVLDGLRRDSAARLQGARRTDDFRASLQQRIPGGVSSRDAQGLQRDLKQRVRGGQRQFQGRSIPTRSFRSGPSSGRPSFQRGGGAGRPGRGRR